jgi:hypothetical protein
MTSRFGADLSKAAHKLTTHNIRHCLCPRISLEHKTVWVRIEGRYNEAVDSLLHTFSVAPFLCGAAELHLHFVLTLSPARTFLFARSISFYVLCRLSSHLHLDWNSSFALSVSNWLPFYALLVTIIYSFDPVQSRTAVRFSLVDKIIFSPPMTVLLLSFLRR